MTPVSQGRGICTSGFRARHGVRPLRLGPASTLLFDVSNFQIGRVVEIRREVVLGLDLVAIDASKH